MTTYRKRPRRRPRRGGARTLPAEVKLSVRVVVQFTRAEARALRRMAAHRSPGSVLRRLFLKALEERRAAADREQREAASPQVEADDTSEGTGEA